MQKFDPRFLLGNYYIGIATRESFRLARAGVKPRDTLLHRWLEQAQLQQHAEIVANGCVLGDLRAGDTEAVKLQ